MPNEQDETTRASSAMTDEIRIKAAKSEKEIAQIREMFEEYAASLDFSLCFQDFDRELASLPGDYAPPNGRLVLADCKGRCAGCGALHPLDGESCEMKRLYVRTAFRGRGIGRALAEALIREAREIGYHRMRLDTIAPRMDRAVELYRQLGFREIAAYRENPIHGAMYMELELG